MRYRAVLIFFSLWVFLSCGVIKTLPLQQRNQLNVPEQIEIKDIPFYSQKAYQCGPAALSMALVWSGLRITADQVAPEVFTPSLKGSLQTAIIGAARRHGRVAYPISRMDSLLRELSAGHPVIVLLNLGISWVPVWHYSLAIGYDLNDNLVILHSGTTARKHVSLNVFERTWARSDYWGLLVLPPATLPATAKEEVYVSAIIGLERAKRWKEALKAYVTALNRWSDNYTAHIGLGNGYYALGDLKAAEFVFREITFRFPNEGTAYNNLAQILSDQGKYGEAFETIRIAIRLGGEFKTQYQETLQEIQAKRKRVQQK